MITYRYYIALNNTANFIEVHPYNTYEGMFKHGREDNSFIYRKRFETDILLIDKASEGITDYSILKEVADGNHPSANKFDKNTFRITKINDSETLIYEGEFRITDCYFNVERRQVNFKSTVKDEYSEFFENGDTDINILEVGGTSITISYKSWLEFSYLAATSPSVPAGDCWSLYYTEDPIEEGRPVGGKLYVYARERIIVPRNTTMSGWTELDYEETDKTKTYVRDYSTTYTAPTSAQWTYRTCGASSPGDTWYQIKPEAKTTLRTGVVTCRMYSRWVLKTVYSGGEYVVDIEHENCRPLKPVLEYVVSQVAPSFSGEVKSRILFNDQYASDYIKQSYNDKNYVTDEDPNPLNELYLEHKSDFIKPDADIPATIGNITFNNLMEDLNSLFAGTLFWQIDADGNFRLEYVYYFQQVMGFDLTNSKYSKYQQADDNFEFLTKDIYNRETWEFQEAGSTDFKKTEINYGSAIAIDGSRENIKEYRIDNITTDIDYLNANLSTISDSRFVLICAEDDGGLVCKQATGLLSGESVQNGDISLANLIYNYGKYNRCAESYSLNGATVSGNTKKYKKQIPIEFVNEDDDIDFSKTIQTSMGLGEVLEAEENMLKKIKVTLLYGD